MLAMSGNSSVVSRVSTSWSSQSPPYRACYVESAESPPLCNSRQQESQGDVTRSGKVCEAAKERRRKLACLEGINGEEKDRKKKGNDEGKSEEVKGP